jgi:hypothetical protein
MCDQIADGAAIKWATVHRFAMVTWLTAFIALIVAFIAALQWITARQKVVLDLFDKRFAVYEELREAITHYLTQPTASIMEDVAKFTRANRRAQFLFGPEVTKFLEDTWLDLTRDVHESTHPPGPDPEERRKAADDKMVRVNRLAKFSDDFDLLVAPYMKHTQKRSPIPFIDA